MIPDVVQRIGARERELVEEVLATGFASSSGGIMMRRFEAAFAERFGSEYAISFVNGTATMHASLEAAGIGVGDEVVVPPLTMSATTFAVLQANATPVFADVDRHTFQLDVDSLAAAITPRTRAVIPVSLYGGSPDMTAIMAVASQNDLLVIEDAAENVLGTHQGRLVGTIGHIGSFSLQASKHLTAGEGGVVLTDDSHLATRIRQVQSLGYAGVGASVGKITKADIQDPTYERHLAMGWNYRMPELCCAVGLAQVERIDELVAVRIRAADAFHVATAAHHDWFVPQIVRDGDRCSYWTWVVRLDRDDLSWHRLRDAFVSAGLESPYGAWRLTHLEPMMRKRALLGRERFVDEAVAASWAPGLCPVAEEIQPNLMQFQTNVWDLAEVEARATLLSETLDGLA